MSQRELSELLSDDLLAAVARRAASCDYRIWGFGEGPALLGMLRAGELLSDAALIDGVAACVAPALERTTDPTDHLIPVEVLLELHRLRPEWSVLAPVDRFCAAVLNAERPKAGQPPVHRPDLSPLSLTIWVDCLHTDLPGLALAGHALDAARLGEEVCAVLQDERGLFSHGYDIATRRPNGVHWGRGQGWALHGLALGPDSPELLIRLDRLVEAIAQTEVDGRWHTIVDNPDAPLENSVSALVASGVLAAVSAGGLSERWLPLGRRALIAAASAVDSDGGLLVSEATPAGNAENYLVRGSGVFPWGQGPLLLALIEGRKFW